MGLQAEGRRLMQDAGSQFLGAPVSPPNVHPHQATGSCHACSLCQPYTCHPVALYPSPSCMPCLPPALPPNPLHALVGLMRPCSSLLRTLFHLLKPGSLMSYTQVCVRGWEGRHVSVSTVQTHKCVSLACTCAHTLWQLSPGCLSEPSGPYIKAPWAHALWLAWPGHHCRPWGASAHPPQWGPGPCMFSKHLGVPGAGGPRVPTFVSGALIPPSQCPGAVIVWGVPVGPRLRPEEAEQGSHAWTVASRAGG